MIATWITSSAMTGICRCSGDLPDPSFVIDGIDVPCPSYSALEIRGLFPFLSACAIMSVLKCIPMS